MKPSCVTVQQYHTEDLVHWPVVRQAGEDFLRQVEKFYVFGDSVETTSALLFTRDQACYAIGFNEHGELGLGHTNQVDQPAEIVELRGCNVVQCVSQGDQYIFEYVAIVTSDGDLWRWGSFWYWQVEDKRNQLRPTLSSMRQQVAMVASGESYVVELHRDGTLWFVGECTYEDDDYYDERFISTPTRMTGLVTSEQRIVHIEVGCVGGCIAFTDDARFYCWKFPDVNPNSTPIEIQFPVGLHLGACSYRESNMIMLNEEGYAYYGYLENDEFRCEQIAELVEPMLSVICFYDHNWETVYCFESRSGQMIMWNRGMAPIQTGLTSFADISVLYGNREGTSVLTTFTPKAASEQVLQPIRKFHNPAKSNFIVTIESRRIYLKWKNVSRLAHFFAAKLKTEYNGDRCMLDYSYVSFFAFLRYVHTGEVGVIDSEWLDQLLAMAIEGGIADLHDLCLYLMTSSSANGIEVLPQSKHWPTVVSHLENVLSVTNSRYYLALAEKICDESLQNRVWMCITKQSLTTARNVLSSLQVLSGQSAKVSALEIPDKYFQSIICHGDDSALIGLLQDSWQGERLSNHIANTVSSDNCFRIFRLAVESKNETLQEKVALFVANLENSFGLYLTEDFMQAESDHIQTLFMKAGVKRFRRDW